MVPEPRLATAHDRPAVEAVVRAAYSRYVSRIGREPGPMLDDYAALIRDGRVHVVVRGGAVKGVLVLRPGPDAMLLDNVAVAPDAQGSGIGRAMLAFAERAAADAGYATVTLYTNEAMTENLELYARIGYSETHRAVEKGLRRIYMAKPVARGHAADAASAAVRSNAAANGPNASAAPWPSQGRTPMTPDRQAATEANRRAWNASAAHHGASRAWDRLVWGFAVPGFSTFDPTITACLRSVGIAGKSLVQIGCNNGREVLSAIALGARGALGIDQSEAFLAQAALLSTVAKTDARFLRADIYDLPPDTPRGFDIALVTIGVLNWMPDLPGFFRAAAGLLAAGGCLVIYETHPFLEMFDPHAADPFTPARSYFATAPVRSEQAIVYDGGARGAAPSSFWFVHRLGDIVHNCVAAGLRIERLEEFPHSNREAEYDRYESRPAQLPLCYTLIARKPAP